MRVVGAIRREGEEATVKCCVVGCSWERHFLPINDQIHRVYTDGSKHTTAKWKSAKIAEVALRSHLYRHEITISEVKDSGIVLGIERKAAVGKARLGR